MALAQQPPHQHTFKMMDPEINRPSSALARGVHITELSDSKVNPQPIVLEETDILLEDYLSPTKLRLLTGVENLENVRSLEMRVDTTDTSLGNFGSILPNLAQLKLSNSAITYIRDLGSSLRSLQVLWMSRCGLQELDGISSMSTLTELYLSYNEVSDLSPLSMLEQLQVLDLEGNNIEDINQVQYLELCSQLRNLTLEANPVCVMPSPDSQMMDYDYRSTLIQTLPQLRYLDDEPVISTTPSKKSNMFDADWAYLEELQKDLSLQSCDSVDSLDDQGSGPGRPSSASKIAAGFRPGSALRPSSGMRPLTSARRGSPGVGARPKTRGSPASSYGRPGTAARPASGEENEVAEAASDLTTGNVICGNPSKALRNRRGESFTPPAKETAPKLFSQYKHKPEHTYDPVPGEDDQNSEILTELKAWRKEHDKLIKKIEEDRAPQVLTILPDEAYDLSDSEEITDSEGEDVDSGVQCLNSFASQPIDREDTSDRLPCHPPTEHSTKPQTREFRSRRYRTGSTDNSDADQRQKTKRPGRHDESFDDDQLISALSTHNSSLPLCGHSPGPPAMSQPEQINDHMNRAGVSPGLTCSKPPVPAINRNKAVIDTNRHVSQEPLRTGSPVPDGGYKSANSSGLAGRPSTSRAALALPSQLRMQRQLPTVPNIQSKPEGTK